MGAAMSPSPVGQLGGVGEPRDEAFGDVGVCSSDGEGVFDPRRGSEHDHPAEGSGYGGVVAERECVCLTVNDVGEPDEWRTSCPDR